MRSFSTPTRILLILFTIYLYIGIFILNHGGWQGEILGISFSLTRPNALFGQIVLLFGLFSAIFARFRKDVHTVVSAGLSGSPSAVVFWVSLFVLGVFIIVIGGFKWQSPLFDLNSETGLGTYFHGFLLIIVAAIALSRGRITEKHRVGWFSLAGIFTAMSLDELTSIHESIPRKLSMGYNGNSIFGLVSWTVLLAPVILGVAAYFIYFSFKLNKQSRAFVFLGVACYLAAVSLEQLILAQHIPVAQVVAEEGIEKVGTAMFIVAYSLGFPKQTAKQ